MKPYSPTNNGYESCQQASTSILYGIYAIGLLVSSWFQLFWHSVENLSKWCSTTAKKKLPQSFQNSRFQKFQFLTDLWLSEDSVDPQNMVKYFIEQH